MDNRRCQYYRDLGECAKNNNENDLGECVYGDGIIRENTVIHCSEGREKLGLAIVNFSSTNYKKVTTDE